MDTATCFLIKLFHLISIVHQTSSQGAPEPQHTFWGYDNFNSIPELSEWVTNNAHVYNNTKISIGGHGGYIYKIASANTIGYHHITIEFTLESPDSYALDGIHEYARVRYQINNETDNWITLEQYTRYNMTPNITDSIELPADTNNNIGVRIRFDNTGSSEHNDVFYIQSVHLTATIITNEPTNNPTIPTNNPTNYPTFPTINPTSYPTIHPTCDPSLEPTYGPTFNPTNHPTTPKPTLVIDTPTSAPTLIITNSNDIITTIQNRYRYKSENNKHFSETSLIYIVCICILSVTVLIIALYLYCRKRKRPQIEVNNIDYNEPLIKKTPGNIITGDLMLLHSYNDSMHDIDGIPNVVTNDVVRRDDNDVVRSINTLTETDTPSFETMHENISIGSVKKKSIELIEFGNNEKNRLNNYFIGETVLVEVKKLLYVLGTIIDIIENGQFIIVKYDNYNHGGTEKLHVINDEYRITSLEISNKNDKHDTSEEEQNDEMDVESVIKDENESNECIICKDKPPRYAMIPCGHYGCCKNCKDMINNQCPICMAKCTVVKIYKQ